jgi:hypothetical protein
VAPASPVTTAAPSANATAPANILETDIFTHPPSPGSLPGGCWVISRRGAAKGSHCQRRPYAFENTRLFLASPEAFVAFTGQPRGARTRG